MGYIGKVPTAVPITTSDLADGIVTTSKLANDSVDNTKLDLTDNYAFTGTITGAGGITEADQWRVTSDFTGDQDPVASNWERNDTDFDKIGTGMTQSSGVFTFPSTGLYYVEYSGVVSSTDENRWTDFRIEFTTNNGSNWNLRASQGNAGFTINSNSIYSSAISSCILDVIDTSTHKVRFSIDFNSTNATARGSSTYQYHGVTFIRLGAT